MRTEVIEGKLAEICGIENVFANEPMSAHTTFEIGGAASLLVTPQSVDQVARVIAELEQSEILWRVIGCGSDLLVSDAGLDCVVVKIAGNLSEVSIDGTTVRAQAGATNKQVADAACEAGLAGYEFASGIPGTVGGAAIMNAGAYDGEFKDAALSVTCVTPDGEIVEMSADQADWGYRHSAFDELRYVVVAVTLSLRKGDAQEVKNRMDELEQRRAEKQPLEMPSAGSTFKRPEGYFVGKLVQDAGLRGCRMGGAQVSTKHTGFVVNAGGATAQDVRDLIAHIQSTIEGRFGVLLEPEVRMWGFDD